VDVGDGSRLCRVHCFHYEDRNPFERRAEGTVTLGIRGNAHQSKVQVGQQSKWESGAEYLVYFREGEKQVATCRVRSVADVLDSADRWLAGATVPEMHAAFDFVDQRTRQRRQISEELAAELSRLGSTLDLRDNTSGFGGSEHGELWAYGGERSCRIAAGADGLEAALLLRRKEELARPRPPVTAHEEAIRAYLEVGHHWWFRRSAGQSALVNVTYGFLAAALAELSDGLLHSDDNAWEYETSPCRPADLVRFFYRAEHALSWDGRARAEQNLVRLRSKLGA
jgi:hypothetical protein